MGKNIVITGGNSGLGKAISELLSVNNNVIVISRTENDNCYKCDVTNPNEVNDPIKKITEEKGNIDVLINCAGVWLAGDLTDNTYEQISNCIEVNTKGPIYTTKAVLPYMYSQGKGLIINVGSTASFDSEEFSAVYNASKWAVRGFTRTMTIVAAKRGVKITGFYPGFMQTDLFKKAGNDYDTSTGLETSKVAKAIEFIVNCDNDVVIPEFGIKDIENY